MKNKVIGSYGRLGNSMIKLSVIIPIYNTPVSYLEHCISSVQENLRLMSDEVEILMINDGSTEPHIETMLKAVETADSRFKYVYKDNSGVSVTRNLGIKMAQGTFIAFIDADDYLEPGALPYMLQTAMHTDVEMVMFGFCYNDVDTKERNHLKQRFEVNKEIIQSLISNQMQWWFPHGTNLASVWGKIYKRETLLSHQISFIQDIAPNEDGFFNLCLLCKIPTFYVDNTLVYHYVIFSDSAIHKFSNCDIRIGKNILPRLEKIANQYSEEAVFDTSISYRALKIIMRAKRAYFTHAHNTKSFRELRTEMNEFLSEPIIKKWIKRFRLRNAKNKRELKNILLLKLHLYPVVLIVDCWKKRKIKLLNFRKLSNNIIS